MNTAFLQNEGRGGSLVGRRGFFGFDFGLANGGHKTRAVFDRYHIVPSAVPLPVAWRLIVATGTPLNGTRRSWHHAVSVPQNAP